MHSHRSSSSPAGTRKGLARVISRAGLCSRSEAARRVREGRVEVNGRIVFDPEHPTRADADRVRVDGRELVAGARVCVMLNKPRGLVTSTSDERGRQTVYQCFGGADLGWLAPVGRLDRASEGLLLFTNDPLWAAGITDPDRGPCKTYHVQVNAQVDGKLLDRLRLGVEDDGEMLAAREVGLLRQGVRNSWLEVVLDEGRNRHIRRMLAAHGLDVLRLVRVAIGGLALGDLAKGSWRHLDDADRQSLAAPSARAPDAGREW